MGKILKYSFIVILGIVLLSGGIYFYLAREGFQVTFNSNGGSIVAPIQTGLKKEVEAPKNPVRDGYVFSGWYLGEEKFDFDSKIEENITLVAHWEEVENVIYTLSFDTLGGEEISDIEIEEGQILENVPQAQKEGYKFLNWNYHNGEFLFDVPIEQDMVFVAKYEKIEEEKTTVTIHFDTSGGSEIEDEMIEIGKLVKMPKEPVKEGYQFAGWYLGDEEFDFTSPVYEDITLVAFWEKL